MYIKRKLHIKILNKHFIVQNADPPSLQDGLALASFVTVQLYIVDAQ